MLERRERAAAELPLHRHGCRRRTSCAAEVRNLGAALALGAREAGRRGAGASALRPRDAAAGGGSRGPGEAGRRGEGEHRRRCRRARRWREARKEYYESRESSCTRRDIAGHSWRASAALDRRAAGTCAMLAGRSAEHLAASRFGSPDDRRGRSGRRLRRRSASRQRGDRARCAGQHFEHRIADDWQTWPSYQRRKDEWDHPGEARRQWSSSRSTSN